MYVRRKRRIRRRYTKRRKPGKIRRNRATVMRVIGRGAISDRTICRLRYSTFVNLPTTTPVSIVSYLFRGNSLYDPDLSGVGTQPIGHDQYSVFYQKYVVKGCSIKVTAIPDPSSPTFVAVTAKNTATSITNVDLLYEKPYTVIKNMAAGQTHATVLRSYYTSRKMLGLSSIKAEDNSYIGLCTSSSPGNAWYWHVSVGPFDQGSLPSTSVKLRVDLIFYVTYFCRNPLPQS